jgi:hypothetical protein
MDCSSVHILPRQQKIGDKQQKLILLVQSSQASRMGDRVQAIAFIKRHVGFNTNMILLARIRKEGEYIFGAMTSSTVPYVAQYMLNCVLYPDKTEYSEHLTTQTTQGFVPAFWFHLIQRPSGEQMKLETVQCPVHAHPLWCILRVQWLIFCCHLCGFCRSLILWLAIKTASNPKKENNICWV